MKWSWPIVGLFLRLFAAAWLTLTLLSSVLGGAGFGLIMGLVLAPGLALGLAAIGTWIQHHQSHLGGFSGQLRAFHRIHIQVPMSPSEAERILASLIQEGLGASQFTLRNHRIQAIFQPPEWSGWWRRWIQTDELIIEVLPTHPGSLDTGGSRLEVAAHPISRLIFGFLWVDGGRNLRRLVEFQKALDESLARSLARQEAGRTANSIEARLAQAELLLLRAQLEPHFFFNTLAHLRELIRIGDQASALSMLDHLLAYARASSDQIRRPSQSLEDELKVVRSYLELMQLRFGERLTFQIQAEEATLTCEVPVGSLLIPVENAIKHGIEPKPTPGRVMVACALRNEGLELSVSDDGPGLGESTGVSGGTGLSNLRDRLSLQYSGAAHLRVETRELGGVLVHMILPIH